MVKYVIKRDGNLEEFSKEKITQAIIRAMSALNSVDEYLANALSEKVVKKINDANKTNVDLEKIQDFVEDILIENDQKELAKRYIIYREKRTEARDVQKLLIDTEGLIDNYIKVNDWRIKENSNMTFSLQGLNNHISSKVTSNYWLEKIYPQEIGEHHRSGDFHIHDLGLLSTYCVGWDLKDLLKLGFGGVSGKLESKPPKHFRAALGQIVNFFYTLQGESAGAQAFSNFDTYLAPFIRYDNLSYSDVKQALQEFIFNVNVPTRVGFQTPFTNITMDLTIPKKIGKEKIIIGGEEQESVYADYQEEVNMLNKAFCEVMTEGDAKNRVFSFPIPTYNIASDFDWENPIVEDIMGMAAKYGIPYFANYMNSEMDPEDARSMCCRLRLDNRELKKRGGGLFGANPLTGSIGVVTINLPRLGYVSKDKEDFKIRLKYLMDLAKESLEIKRKILEKLTENNLYPYSRHYLHSIKEATGKYWSNHFSTIGLVGMNEACINLLGENIASKEGLKFSEEVLDYMRNTISDYQEQTGDLFNLEATPAEGTSYRLARKDKENFSDIIVCNEKNYRTKNAPAYYTNSSQLPVGFTSDIFEALDHQDKLQTKYTGGTVHHIFLGESLPNWKAASKLIKKICENYEIPYITLSPTFSICPIHGFIAGKHEYCPICAEMDDDKVENPKETKSVNEGDNKIFLKV